MSISDTELQAWRSDLERFPTLPAAYARRLIQEVEELRAFCLEQARAWRLEVEKTRVAALEGAANVVASVASGPEHENIRERIISKLNVLALLSGGG